jgi:hypothetical protein
LGIGTTSPEYTLDVNGTTRAERYRGINSLVLTTYTTANPASNVFLYSQPNDRDAWIFLDSADGGSNWGMYHRQIDSTVSGLPANSIGFIGGGSSGLQAYISLANGNGYFAGNVGIGTTSPGAKLHAVYSGTAAYGTGIKVQNTTAGSYAVLTMQAETTGYPILEFNRGGTSQWQIFNDPVNDNIEFFKFGYGSPLSLRSNGNVGIGTTSPVARLNVYGTGTANDPTLALDITTTSAFIHAQESFAANITTGQAVINVIGREGSTKNSGYIGYLYSGTAGSNNNKLTFGHWGADHLMVMDGLGNVGIGTTSPAGKLSVVTTSAAGSDIALWNNRHVVIGPNAGSTTGGALGLGYNTGQSRCEIASIAPNVAWQPLHFFSTDIQFNTQNSAFSVIINSSGNVGIGTTSPAVHSATNSALVIRGAGTSRGIIELHDGGGTGKAVFQQVGSTTYVGNLAGAGDLILLTNGTGTSAAESIVIKANGNVGINTTSPSTVARLHTNGNKILVTSTSSGWGQLQVANTSDGESTIAIAAGGSGSPGNDTTYTRQWIVGINPFGVGVDRFSITNKTLGASAPFTILNDSGNVGIGSTNPATYKLEVTGTIYASADVIAYSDARVKENVTTIDNALNKVSNLRGVYYTRKDIEKKDRNIGVIAQEVLDIVPELVSYSEENDQYAVKYQNITALLIEAIKELKAEIDVLKQNNTNPKE